MTYENFVYWCQGFIEIQNPITIPSGQLQEIKNHLSLVLKNDLVLGRNEVIKPEYVITGNYNISLEEPIFIC